MSWWIALTLAVLGLAVAWWTSGRSTKSLPPGRGRSGADDYLPEVIGGGG
jgi:hypothetical protein